MYTFVTVSPCHQCNISIAVSAEHYECSECAHILFCCACIRHNAQSTIKYAPHHAVCTSTDDNTCTSSTLSILDIADQSQYDSVYERSKWYGRYKAGFGTSVRYFLRDFFHQLQSIQHVNSVCISNVSAVYAGIGDILTRYSKAAHDNLPTIPLIQRIWACFMLLWHQCNGQERSMPATASPILPGIYAATVAALSVAPIWPDILQLIAPILQSLSDAPQSRGSAAYGPVFGRFLPALHHYDHPSCAMASAFCSLISLPLSLITNPDMPYMKELSCNALMVSPRTLSLFVLHYGIGGKCTGLADMSPRVSYLLPLLMDSVYGLSLLLLLVRHTPLSTKMEECKQLLTSLCRLTTHPNTRIQSLRLQLRQLLLEQLINSSQYMPYQLHNSSVCSFYTPIVAGQSTHERAVIVVNAWAGEHLVTNSVAYYSFRKYSNEPLQYLCDYIFRPVFNEQSQCGDIFSNSTNRMFTLPLFNELSEILSALLTKLSTCSTLWQQQRTLLHICSFISSSTAFRRAILIPQMKDLIKILITHLLPLAAPADHVSTVERKQLPSLVHQYMPQSSAPKI